MAAVYLAEDLKHHRKVAIKVLNPELAAVLGPQRFLREIEIAAGLNHPHILPLHDSGEAGGFLYYVMPFVEGESLRTRLSRGGELPIPEAVRILRDVTDALVAAHRHGVIHRDIKPDNIMLLGNHAVVADFGIAKAVSEAAGYQTLTTAGVALGTPAYMAPEQAVADPHVDHRADIYALGVVAYELLTGRPPFSGTTPQEVLVAHVTEVPEPVSTRRDTVPRPLADLVMHCLAKKPADRWQSAEDMLHELEGLATPGAGTTPTTMMPVAVSLPRGRRAVMMAGAAALTAVAAGAWWITHRPPPSFVFGRSLQVTSDPGLEIYPALSPDGRLVAYAAGNAARMRIYIRTVAGGRTIPLSDDSTAVEYQPRWSPDGNQLLYLTHGGVSIAPALGGTGRPVVAPSATSNVASAAWSPDGREIAFVRGDSLLVRPVRGGATRVVTIMAVHSCDWSPDGRWIACVAGNMPAVRPSTFFGNLAPSAVVLIPAAGGAPRPITDSLESNQSPVWSPDGHRLFFVSNRQGPRDVYAQEITSSGAPGDAPSRVTTGLNAQSLSMAADGRRLAYNVYVARSNVWSLPIPANPPVTADAAKQVTTGNQLIESLTPSADGKWLLYDSDLRGNADIFRVPIAGGEPQQLTADSFDEFAPSLSPDGRLLAYHSFRTGSRDIEVKPLDGSAVERITNSPRQESYPAWSPDGRRLLYWDQDPPMTVMVVTRLGSGRWSPPDTVVRGAEPRWSPDGREIAVLGIDSSGSVPSPAVFVVSLASHAKRLVYADRAGPRHIGVSGRGLWWAPDGRMYLKTHDPAGHAFIWQVAEGKAPRLLVRFPDLNRPSNRPDFAADRTHFYFTFEDRESDVFVADLTTR